MLNYIKKMFTVIKKDIIDIKQRFFYLSLSAFQYYLSFKHLKKFYEKSQVCKFIKLFYCYETNSKFIKKLKRKQLMKLIKVENLKVTF